jgi:hypothetical protein
VDTADNRNARIRRRNPLRAHWVRRCGHRIVPTQGWIKFMTRHLSTNAQLHAFEEQARNLSHDQLLQLVLAELPSNYRIRERLELIVAGNDADQVLKHLHEQLDEAFRDLATRRVLDTDIDNAINTASLVVEKAQDHLLCKNPSLTLQILERLLLNDGRFNEAAFNHDWEVDQLFEQAARVWFVAAHSAGLDNQLAEIRIRKMGVTNDYGTLDRLLAGPQNQ